MYWNVFKALSYQLLKYNGLNWVHINFTIKVFIGAHLFQNDEGLGHYITDPKHWGVRVSFKLVIFMLKGIKLAC